MKSETTSENLPAVQTTDSLPAQVESLEFSTTTMNELVEAIEHAEKFDKEAAESVRVDAVYFDTTSMKKDQEFVRMIAGYSWRKSDFGEGQVPSITLYDVEQRQFEYAMQTALVGKCIEAKLPRGQMIKITYLGKEKGKKYHYENFKVEVLVPKAGKK